MSLNLLFEIVQILDFCEELWEKRYVTSIVAVRCLWPTLAEACNTEKNFETLGSRNTCAWPQ